jgi:formylglycine-generating enzyme required for sulfatase activity
VVGGYKPPAGSGKHGHLAGGGLSLVGGGKEPGWLSSWNTQLVGTKTGWDAKLAIAGATWTPSPSTSDWKPIVGMSWYDAYAFCIWDGAFLPSNAEFEYASAGGGEQRKYPWGSTGPGADAKLAVYGCYYPPGPCLVAPVGSAQLGNGKWGHADLAGNVTEFVFDGFGSLPPSCTDCANPTGVSVNPFYRSGSYSDPATAMETTYFDGGSTPGDNFLGWV